MLICCVDSLFASADLSGETCAAWDSMAHIRIVLSLEERLGVRLRLDELETSMSRRALLELLSVADRQDRPDKGARPTRP